MFFCTQSTCIRIFFISTYQSHHYNIISSYWETKLYSHSNSMFHFIPIGPLKVGVRMQCIQIHMIWCLCPNTYFVYYVAENSVAFLSSTVRSPCASECALDFFSVVFGSEGIVLFIIIMLVSLVRDDDDYHHTPVSISFHNIINIIIICFCQPACLKAG